jgi:hypothetical protein
VRKEPDGAELDGALRGDGKLVDDDLPNQGRERIVGRPPEVVAGEQPEHDEADRPDIGGGRDQPRVLHLLRSHVEWRSER